MITGRKDISINAVGNGPIIFTTPISQLPDLVKNYLWQGYFNVSGQTYPDLSLRCKSIRHNQGQNEFTLSFDEYQDMYATNTLQSIFKQNLQFDFTYKLYDSAIQNPIYTKTYYNVMITGIDEFDLDQESNERIKVTVHCKY